MRVLTLKTRTPANIKSPGYHEYTINFKYYFYRASGVYGENTRMKRELREYIYIYISEIESALASLAQLYIHNTSSIIDVLDWWKNAESDIPTWASSAQKVLLVQPSSASDFSLLKNSFNKQEVS